MKKSKKPNSLGKRLKIFGKRAVCALAIAGMMMPSIPQSQPMRVEAKTEGGKAGTLTYGGGKGTVTTKNGSTLTGDTVSVSNVKVLTVRGKNGALVTTYGADVNIKGQIQHVTGACGASGAAVSSGSGTGVVSGGQGIAYMGGSSQPFSFVYRVITLPDGTTVEVSDDGISYAGDAGVVVLPPPPPPRGNVQVIKKSSSPQFDTGNSNYSLAGAEFSVNHQEGTGTVTTGGDGKSNVLENLLCFSATVQEHTPPKGFVGNSSVLDVEVPENDTGICTFYNEPYRVPVNILLVKDDGELALLSGDRKDVSTRESQGDGVLSGAEFHVTLYDKAGGSKILEFDTKSVGYEGSDYGIIDFAKSPIENFVSHTGFEKDDYLNKDTNGYFSFPLGYLEVTETKAPTGYTLDAGDTYVTIDGAKIEDKTFHITFSESDASVSDTVASEDTNEYAVAIYTSKTSEADLTVNTVNGNGEFYLKSNGTTHKIYYKIGKANYTKDADGVNQVTSYTPKTGVLTLTDEQYAEFNNTGANVVFVIAKDGSVTIQKPDGDNISYYMYVQRLISSGNYTSENGESVTTSQDFYTQKKQYITIEDADTVIDYDSVKKRYFIENGTTGEKIYLTYTYKGTEYPYIPLDYDMKPVSMNTNDVESIGLYHEKGANSYMLQNDGTTKAIGGGADASYLIEWKRQVHVNEQVIRGDVQIQKWDLEYDKSEANGANNKSNSMQTDADLAKSYAGTHLNGITFAITNISNHYVIVDDNVVLPNEVACYITTHWNEEKKCYTAETTGNRLPYGTYSIREWSQDFNQTYNLSDTQARIFEIREQGVTVTDGWKVNDTKKDAVSLDKKTIVEYVQDGTLNQKESMIFKNWVVRGDIELEKITDTASARLSTLFMITNDATGERHLIYTDENGEYKSYQETYSDGTNTPIDGGFPDHDVNTNALEKAVTSTGQTLLELVDSRKEADEPIIFAPISEGGDLPDSLFMINSDTGEYTLNKYNCGGIWFSKGEDGTYTTWDAASNKITTTADVNAVVGVPEHTNPDNWNSAQATGNFSGTFASDGITKNSTVSLTTTGFGKLEDKHPDVLSDKNAIHEDGYHDDFRTATLREHTFGALPYGSYTLTEIRTDTNRAYHLQEFKFKVTTQGVVKDLGTITDDLIEIFLSTKAYDVTSMTQVGLAAPNQLLKDVVSYEGCQTNMNYTIKGSLWDLTDDVPVTYDDGENVICETAFTPTNQKGEVEVYFGEYEITDDNGNPVKTGKPLDMSRYAGHTIVIFEQLYDNQDNLVADHVDKEDVSQMVYFPKLDSVTKGTVIGANEDITDTVTYDSVKQSDGYSYSLVTSVLKGNGEPLTSDDMELFAKDNIFRNKYGINIPVSKYETITDYFTYKTVPEKIDYNLVIALYDKTTGDYVYDGNGNIVGDDILVNGDMDGDTIEAELGVDTRNLSGHEIVALELFYRIWNGYVGYDFLTNSMYGFSFNAGLPAQKDITDTTGVLQIGETYNLVFTMRDGNNSDVKDSYGNVIKYELHGYTPDENGITEVPVNFLTGDSDMVDADKIFDDDITLHVEVSGGPINGAIPDVEINIKRFGGTKFTQNAGSFVVNDVTVKYDEPIIEKDKTVKVDDKGSLTGASGVPYIIAADSAIIEDNVLLTNMLVGDTYTVRAELYGDGKKIDEESVTFEASDSAEYQKVIFDNVMTKGIKEFTVKEFVGPADGDVGINHELKKISTKSLVYDNDVCNDFGEYYVKATKVYPNEGENSGETSATFTLDTRNLEGLDCVFVNEMYTIDRMGNYYLSAVHDDLRDVDEQFKFGYPTNEGSKDPTPYDPPKPKSNDPSNPKPTKSSNKISSKTPTKYSLDEPYFGTTATVDGKKTIDSDAKGTITIVDVVDYSGYEAKNTYTMKGTLMVKSTGKALTDSNGQPITASTKFTSKENGSVTVKFKVDASLIPDGESIVVFEQMLDSNKSVVARHEDINDANQTISKGKVEEPYFRTTAVSAENGSKVIPHEGKVTIIDTIEYGNYEENKQYIMVGYLVDKKTGEVLLTDEDEPYTVETAFTCKGTGTVEMKFTIDASKFEPGDEIVVFENMCDTKYNVIASHTDINDAGQTVVVKSYNEVQTGVKVFSVYGLFGLLILMCLLRKRFSKI